MKKIKKKLYLICIRNTLNNKIRNTLKLKKKIICSTSKQGKKKKAQKKFELKSEKKKNCNRAKLTASPIDYKGSPRILKKKKKKKQRIRNQTHATVTSLAEKS